MTQLKGFKFATILVLVFKKMEREDKTKYENFHSSSKAEIIINENDIHNVFQSIFTTIITNTQKSLGEGSGWIIDSVIDHTISISKYNPLAGSSYIQLPIEVDHPRKGSINIQSIDDKEFFKYSLVRYVNHADHHPAWITKADKDFAETFDIKYISFSAKIRDIHKIKNKNSISISVFENEEKSPIYLSKKCCKEKNADLLFIAEGKKSLCSYQWFQ